MLNRGYAFATIIGGKDHGQTVLSHLAGEYPHSTAEVWQEVLCRGEVTVDGVVVGGSELLIAGQRLVWQRPPWDEPDVPWEFGVLYEDEHLLAVNKPSGLPTIPGGGFLENTLLRLVQRKTPEANPVHRLGRATSGIVLFAKSAEAAARLSADWNTAKVQKVYRAVATGVAERETYEIVTPIGLVPHPRLGSVWAANAGGKASRSVARVIARGAGTTTFEVGLHSGRPHQIRIHLASIGHPLVDDPLYGVGGLPLEVLPGLPGDGGYRLHAEVLRFEHPMTGKRFVCGRGCRLGFRGLSSWRLLYTAEVVDFRFSVGSHAVDDAARRDSGTMLGALGVLAYAVSMMTHEGLGHGGYCLVAGGHTTVLTAWWETCLFPGVPAAAIKAAGPGVQFAAGLLAWWMLTLLPARVMRLRYFLWLTMVFDLFVSSSYLAFSGVTNLGDAAELIAGLHPAWAWRGGLMLLGGVLYCLSMCAASFELKRLCGLDPESERLFRLVWIPYVSAGVFACCTAALTMARVATAGLAMVSPALNQRMGAGAALEMALLSSFGAGSGMFGFRLCSGQLQEPLLDRLAM